MHVIFLPMRELPVIFLPAWHSPRAPKGGALFCDFDFQIEDFFFFKKLIYSRYRYIWVLLKVLSASYELLFLDFLFKLW